MTAGPDPHQLIAEFGRNLGIPDVGFDERGHCRLGFDNVELDMTWLNAPGELVVTSPVGECPARRNDEFCAKLLEINLAGALSSAGAVGIDRATERIVYTDHTPLRGLTLESLARFIKMSVDLVEAWRGILATPEFTQHDSRQQAEGRLSSALQGHGSRWATDRTTAG
jgi:hypothetical protein